MRLLPGSLLLAVALLASLAAGCSDSQPEAGAPPATAVPTATPAPAVAASPSPTATPTVMPSPSPTPTATPPPTPTPDPRPARCAGLEERAALLVEAIEEKMEGYTGGWGVALVDLDCDATFLINPEHSQYPASAGKIMVVIAALRAVQDGLLEFEGELQGDIEVVLSLSLDAHADRINGKVTTEQIAAVLERAGVSGESEIEHSWRYANFTPEDLARVWISLVRGEQLNEELTAYLLDLATRPVLGAFAWPFPPDFGIEGYVFGQKAGFWTSEVPVAYRVSAGYLRPEDDSSEGYVFAFMVRAVWEDLRGNWQRPVFPLVRDFMVAELGEWPSGEGE